MTYALDYDELINTITATVSTSKGRDVPPDGSGCSPRTPRN